MGDLVLIRHGQTAWSLEGRHTGVTDVPLTDAGRDQARALGGALGSARFALVLVSPRRRARETAELAGLAGRADDEDVVVDDRLVEWDYGGYEGRTSAEISAALGRPWTLFGDGTVPGDTPGETAHDVAARARAVLTRVRPVLEAGEDVALVGHGHQLRVLATQWIGLDPVAGAALRLDAGSLSRLGVEHAVPVVALWNYVPA